MEGWTWDNKSSCCLNGSSEFLYFVLLSDSSQHTKNMLAFSLQWFSVSKTKTYSCAHILTTEGLIWASRDGVPPFHPIAFSIFYYLCIPQCSMEKIALYMQCMHCLCSTKLYIYFLLMMYRDVCNFGFYNLNSYRR